MKAVLILSLCCIYVRAQSTAVLGAVFDGADINKDGSVDLSEYRAVFALFDANGDGAVSKNEFVTAWISQTGATEFEAEVFFGERDSNGDLSITPAELTISFDKYDADGDGLVSKAEFLKRVAETKPKTR